MLAALAEGAQPDDAARLKIGRALVTGIGAPRSIPAGLDLLEPLARAWNGEAAALSADALAAFDQHEDAYEAALIALAAGELSAMGVADRMESLLPVPTIMSLQVFCNNGTMPELTTAI